MRGPGDSQDTTWTDRCTEEFAKLLAAELDTLNSKISCLTRSRDTVRTFLEQTRHASLLEPA